MINRRDMAVFREVASRLVPAATSGATSLKRDFIKTSVTAIASGLISSLLTIGVFAYQATKQADGWNRQNEIEYKTRVISEKNEIARNLRQLIVRYYDFDMQTGIETHMRVVRSGLEIAYPGKSKEILKELPELMPGDQLREHREIYSSLLAMAVSVRIHFGDEVADKLDRAIFILKSYPNNFMQPIEFARRLKAMEVNGQPDMDRLYTELKRIVSHPSTLPEGLFSDVISDMIESVRRDIRDRQVIN